MPRAYHAIFSSPECATSARSRTLSRLEAERHDETQWRGARAAANGMFLATSKTPHEACAKSVNRDLPPLIASALVHLVSRKRTDNAAPFTLVASLDPAKPPAHPRATATSAMRPVRSQRSSPISSRASAPGYPRHPGLLTRDRGLSAEGRNLCSGRRLVDVVWAVASP
jgi:hypothetical protein